MNAVAHAAAAGRNAPACVTDRCDRCDRRVDVIISHLSPAFCSHKNTRPTPPGWVFCSLRAPRAGLPPSAPSAPSESMGAAHLSSLEPWRLSRGGKEGGDSRARTSEERAREFLSRRVLKSRDPRDFCETQRREVPENPETNQAP